MKPEDLSDDELLYVVGTTDAEMFRNGIEITRRDWEVPQAVMKKFGYVSYVMGGRGTPLILERIRKAFKSIYRPQDIAVGGHIGVFMYRDIFAQISAPHIVGTVTINPFNFVELTPVQLRMIQIEPENVSLYLDQFTDIMDVQYGAQEVKAPYRNIELLARFLDLSGLHLHSAAAVLTGGYEYRGAVQSALLATELALKAGAASQNLTEAEIKTQFGHDNQMIADFVSRHFPQFDIERVRRVLSKQPKYVPNRYAATQPSRLEVGHIVMSAQYLVAEVMRLFSDRDFRASLPSEFKRTYPA